MLFPLQETTIEVHFDKIHSKTDNKRKHFLIFQVDRPISLKKSNIQTRNRKAALKLGDQLGNRSMFSEVKTNSTLSSFPGMVPTMNPSAIFSNMPIAHPAAATASILFKYEQNYQSPPNAVVPSVNNSIHTNIANQFC